MTRVYLLRHGKTVGGHERRYKGRLDVPLSDEGVRQIEKAAAFIQRHTGRTSAPPGLQNGRGSENSAVEIVYCSKLLRAIKSAETLSRPLGLVPVSIERLGERDFGRWEGMTFDEIGAAYPGEFDAWAKDPLRFSPVGGESTQAVFDRVMPVFTELVEKHKDRTLAVVAHGGVNRVILCGVLGIPLENVFRIEQDFAAVNVIEFYEDYPVIRLLNHVEE
jgi:alpha-ribazole phosphatase/probable phosphoglycerate mutase